MSTCASGTTAIGNERQRLGQADDALAPARAPGQARAAGERRSEVVGVALELETELDELLDLEGPPGRSARRHEAEGDRRGARAEPAVQRDAVREDEAPPLDRREESERADAEVLRARRQLAGARPYTSTPGPVAHLELVPELERDAGAVEARRRGWRSSPARGR